MHVIRLVRPDRANALDRDVVGELAQCLHEARRSPAVVLAGSGGFFCAGLHRDEFDWLFESRLKTLRRMWPLQDLIRVIAALPVPVISYADGAVAGGGCGLFWAGDRALAGPGFKLQLAFARVGLASDMGTSRALARRTGRIAARRLYLSDPRLDTADAAAFGLVDGVAASEDEAAALASSLRATGALSRPRARRMALDAGLAWETIRQAWLGSGRPPAASSISWRP